MQTFTPSKWAWCLWRFCGKKAESNQVLQNFSGNLNEPSSSSARWARIRLVSTSTSLFKDHTVTKQTILNRFIFQKEIKPQLKTCYWQAFLSGVLCIASLHSFNCSFVRRTEPFWLANNSLSCAAISNGSKPEWIIVKVIYRLSTLEPCRMQRNRCDTVKVKVS